VERCKEASLRAVRAAVTRLQVNTLTWVNILTSVKYSFMVDHSSLHAAVALLQAAAAEESTRAKEELSSWVAEIESQFQQELECEKDGFDKERWRLEAAHEEELWRLRAACEESADEVEIYISFIGIRMRGGN
jgi:hypothetical protein